MGKSMGAPRRALRAGLRPRAQCAGRERSAPRGQASHQFAVALSRADFCRHYVAPRGFGFDRGPAAAAPSKRRPQTVSRKAAPQAPSWGLEPRMHAAAIRESGAAGNGEESGRRAPEKPKRGVKRETKAKGFELRGARAGRHGQNKKRRPGFGPPLLFDL